MQSASGDSTDDQCVQPIKVGPFKTEDGGWEWQRFVSFRPASQVETVQRRQWGAFGSKLIEGIKKSLQTCRHYQSTIVDIMNAMLQLSQLQAVVTLESNIRSELIIDAPLDPDIVDQLELDNLVALDRHVAIGCRFFGIATPPPEGRTVDAAKLRRRINDNLDRLLECVRQVDPLWATKMNECAKDVHLAKAIENLLDDVGNAHRSAGDANQLWLSERKKFFNNMDNLERVVHWVYKADQDAVKRRLKEKPTDDKAAKDGVDELVTQLRWLYEAAIELARERRRFVELCNMHMDIANEVRLQRYDPENATVKFKKRQSYTGQLPELASQLFSAFWDEEVERCTQMRIVGDEAKRLADTWKRDNKRYAALKAECNELARLPEQKTKELDDLRALLEGNHQAGQELIACLESIVPSLKTTTSRLQRRGADREKAQAEALQRGAATAFDPVLNDRVMNEIDRKERRLEDSMLRRQDAVLSRAEALENLQHTLCHREKERESLEKHLNDLQAELAHVDDEIAALETENRLQQSHADNAADNKPDERPLTTDDYELVKRVDLLRLQVTRRRKLVDKLQLQKANLRLKIQCMEKQKKIVQTASEEKEKTIREFEKHLKDSKKAVTDRLKFDALDSAPPAAADMSTNMSNRKIDKLKKRIDEFKETLQTMLSEADLALRKHADLSTNNLKLMDAHRALCYKVIVKEMELHWNQMQLRKILCERGVPGGGRYASSIVEEHHHHQHTGNRKFDSPHSPVILYHELSTPVKKRLERGRMPPMPPSGSHTAMLQSPRSAILSTMDEAKYRQMDTTRLGTLSPISATGYSVHRQKQNKMFTVTETIRFSHSINALKGNEGRLQWRTELDEKGQPTLSDKGARGGQADAGPSRAKETAPSSSDNTAIISMSNTKTIAPDTTMTQHLKTASSSPPTSFDFTTGEPKEKKKGN